MAAVGCLFNRGDTLRLEKAVDGITKGSEVTVLGIDFTWSKPRLMVAFSDRQHEIPFDAVLSPAAWALYEEIGKAGKDGLKLTIEQLRGPAKELQHARKLVWVSATHVAFPYELAVKQTA